VETFLNLVISGIVTGAIYSIMASGLVLTYQTSGIFNFAHGAIAFATAYFYYQLHTGLGMPIVPAAILSVLIFAPVMGIALDAILLRRLAGAPIYARIVGTIGLLVALPNLALWLVETLGDGVLGLDLPKVSDLAGSGGHAPGIGPDPSHVYRPFGWLGLSKIHLNSDQLAVFIAAVIAALVLWYVVRKTRAGLEMRAVVDRESLAALRGINQSRSSQIAWILTMVLAGIGGILITPLFQLNPDLFTLVVLGSLAAVAISGLRSIPIAFAGGVLLGVVQNLVAGYKDDILPSFLDKISGLSSSVPFFLTLILLFFIARDRSRAAGSVADAQPPPDHRAGQPAWRRRLPWTIVTIAILGFALQWINVAALQADNYEQAQIALGLVYAIIFLSFVVVTGLGGMVSLAQATFVTAGGFATGWALNRDWGDIPVIAPHGQLNFALCALIGALCAAALGALIALPVRRLSAVALALGTFALAFVASLIPFDYDPIGKGSFGWPFSGTKGIPPSQVDRALPSLDVDGGLGWLRSIVDPGSDRWFDFSQPRQQVILGLIVFGLITLLIHFLQHSASGRAMLATRSSEVAARASGISPAKAKFAIFALSAAIAGFGGAMFGLANGAISSSSASPLVGLVWLAVAVTFGVRRPGGALLAGLGYTCTQLIFLWLGSDIISNKTFHDLTTAVYFTPILFGLGAINLAKDPDGLLSLLGGQRAERRRKRALATAIAAAEAEAHGGLVPEHEVIHAAVPATEPESLVPVGAPVEPDGQVAALSLQGIVAGYGDVEVLHGVDVEVMHGTVVAMLGANGAGKSTLCSVAAGLLEPTQGKVFFAGRDVTAEPAYRRARDGILLVPEARGIFPGLSVEENLRVLLRTDEQREIAYERFPILGQRRRQSAGLLSGGEQQMLSLAPALAHPPDVFIADEPTLGLAPMAAEEVVHALRELREKGCAILLVEEKAREVMELADIVAFMELGQLVWMGPREEADSERLAAAYLGGGLSGD
jgi:ABC-type branched-subunit amino acid transport system ATPase component/branched-subunit amino acid ABC-type transport system permease component